MIFAAFMLPILQPMKPIAEPFPLSAVRVTTGPFAAAEKRCAAYLLEIDPDRLLSGFRVNAGLEPKGQRYGGWEGTGLAGHSLGHYLTALSQRYASTGDTGFKEKIDYVVSELVACQKNRPDGYLAAMPDGDRVWGEVKKGQIRSGGFDLNGLWSPWYTHHKVLAGLLDAHRFAGNTQALNVARKFADWAIDTTKDLTPELWERMLACEYGGMNESLAELHLRTGEARYLELARKFYDRRVLDPLAKGEDSLPGRHSNTQIPKLIGLARLYEIAGREQDRKAAEFFWQTVVRHHTYVIGGNSNHEYFGPAGRLSDRLSTNTCETCNTYNMLRLTRRLFSWDPKVEFADYDERALFNHILASQNPEDGMMTYFMPLSSGSHRRYSNRFGDWTCCHGSGMESHTKHAEGIYFHSGRRSLYVNLFIPSELKWEGQTIRMETAYPSDGKVTLTFGGKARTFELAVRHPGWATGALVVTVDGKPVARSDRPGDYVRVKRRWSPAEKIGFEVPLTLRAEAMPDNPKRFALLYGPAVLAADLGPTHGEQPRTPVLVTGDRPLDRWLSRRGGALEFHTVDAAKPSDLVLKPFATLNRNRYAVYFDRFTEAEWRTAEVDYRKEEARVRDLEARTVDFVRIGEMQAERDHHLKSERNDVRSSNGRGFRTPLSGGWFEFELKVDAAGPNRLVVTYWGNERHKPAFDILVDSRAVAEETLSGLPANRFTDVEYPLPESLTSGKEKVTVRFQAKPGQAGGSISDVRSIRG